MTTQLPSIVRNRIYIDGEFVDAIDGSTFETFEPATGTVLATVAAGGAADIDIAVAAARRSFDEGGWSRIAPAERKATLLRFAALIEQHASDLALFDAVEAGKPIADTEDGDLPDVVSTLRWYAEAVDKVFGKVSPTGEGNLGLIVTEPVGVVGIVVPWNFPLAVLMLKLAPALAAGNSVVIKPPELATLSTLRLADLAAEAGIPRGVFNVVPGLGHIAGKALGLHDDVDVIAFTGSTEVGRYFLQYSAQSNLKQVVLELGGKSPQIVTASMAGDLERVAADLSQAAFWNSGQNCTAGSRILVDNSIKADFVEALARIAGELTVGNPLDRSANLGPLIEPAALERVLGFIREAEEAGATVVTGGTRLHEETGGWFVGATVIDGVSEDSRIAREEIFGPVVTVLGYDTEEDAIRIANDTRYGLDATVWTRDLDQAFRLARAIRAGTVAINGYSEGDVTTPFGGYRTSGFGGRDKGLEAFDQYTEVKTIWFTLQA
jgi:gamma-glutamyl-gamma-aminobutyraldehyde dehydrogenase